MSKLILILSCLPILACASLKEHQFADGQSLQPVQLMQATSNIMPGDVVFLGEYHNSINQHDYEMAVLRQLRGQGLRVSVGFEFFNYPNQGEVNSWRQGALPESQMLQRAFQGRADQFDFYREQAQWPRLNFGEMTVALNLPMNIAGAIREKGVEQLNAQERSFLPRDFQIGNDLYKERFTREMQNHGELPVNDPQVLRKYFEAQSAWDDVMAVNAKSFLDSHQDQVLVVIVGEFHSRYGGGLPDRLLARGYRGRVHRFGMVALMDGMPESVYAPSARYGIWADYLFPIKF